MQRSRYVVLAFPLAVVRCGSEPAAPAPGSPAIIRAVNGNNQSVDPGVTLPERLTVKVTDTRGTPVPAVAVRWVLRSGSGTLNPTAGITDVGGKTSTTLHLTSRPGNREVVASVATDADLSTTFTVLVGGGDAGDGPQIVVAVGDNFFRPSVASVAVNELVEFRWIGVAYHAVTFDDPGICSRDITDSASTAICKGGFEGSWTHRFARGGTFPYRCMVHPEQTGTVIVQ